MTDAYKQLEADYRAGKISRRKFLRYAAALGVVITPALLNLPGPAGAGESPTEEPVPTEEPLPTLTPLTLSSVSPRAGAPAGGFTVALSGQGFLPGAAVYFGSAPSTDVTWQDGTTLHARVPAAPGEGSVSVSVVNPDGASALEEGGFTYVTYDESEAAQVSGITPLAVLEGTETELTLRGRNLIRAYDEGLVALRGPSRAHLVISGVTSSRDEATGTEALTLRLQVSAQPALGPLERLAIQVLASTRAGAAQDLIVETSRQMFSVLPGSVPVPLAYTAAIEPGRPQLVAVVGRSLEGCRLDFDQGVIVHMHSGGAGMVAGVVSLDPEAAAPAALMLRLRGPEGVEVARYEMAVGSAEAAGLAGMPPPPIEDPDPAEAPGVESLSGTIGLALTPVPGQQFSGPTAGDSTIVSLRGGALNTPGFNWINFEIIVVDVLIILPIVNEVRVVSFFDGGGPVLEAPILAKVGRLFPVRGMGLLVAARIEVIIHIQVVLIIGIIFDLWPYGLYNEFPALYPWVIGTVVIGIEVRVEIILFVSWMIALIEPDGRLRMLAVFNLTLGIDFNFSADRHYLHFDPDFTYAAHFTGVGPLAGLLPCAGRFQLADDNGQTVFPDSFGGYQSFYFAHAAGPCCAPWNFDLQLVRFTPGQGETVVQDRFETEICLNALASPDQIQILITATPPPTGVPLRLDMTIGQSAMLRALAQPVDASGTPTGPAQDVRDLGYEVEFYLETPPDVLDPSSLRPGNAFAVLDGESLIRAAVTSVQVIEEGPMVNFWPGGILGFDILRFLAEGQPPRLRTGGLPVVVHPLAGAVQVEPLIAYRTASGQIQPVDHLERSEPFETQRNYFLAARVTFPPEASLPLTLTLSVSTVQMFLVSGPAGSPNPPVPGAPLEGIVRADGRDQVRDAKRFFNGAVLDPNAQASVTVSPRKGGGQLVGLDGLTIRPNHVEVRNTQTGMLDLVPPGAAPRGRSVQLQIGLKAPPSGPPIALSTSLIKIAVRNAETLEEYRRVLLEAREIMADAVESLGSFARFFYAELEAQLPAPGPGFLNNQGRALWAAAWTTGQASGLVDDRVLYYARLESIAALRAFYSRRQQPIDAAIVNHFEWPSRGLEPDGRISFSGLPAGTRKAIVLGFDPFGLASAPGNANVSGIVALSLHRQSLGQGLTAAHVRTAIFPVRYADFEAGLVENALEHPAGPAVKEVVLLLTTSENGSQQYYDVERFAAKARIGVMDNNGQTRAASSTLPLGPGRDGTASFLEASLPTELVITSRERLPGPNGPTPFVFDQSYRVRGDPGERRRGPNRTGGVRAGLFRPEPEDGEPEAYERQQDTPDITLAAAEGSGGAFLSNEVFFRALLARLFQRAQTLSAGHLHLPLVDVIQTGGQAAVLGTHTAIARFLEHSFLMGRTLPVRFPRTRVGFTSAPISGPLVNETAAPITVERVALANGGTGFSCEPATPLPVTLNPNESLTLRFRFEPNALGQIEAEARAFDNTGQVLRLFLLSGEGIPITPSISGFTPIAGRVGSEVTIRGENFYDASEVRIGGRSVPFQLIDPATLRASVTEEALTGPITVETPTGTATSSRSFIILRRPPPSDPVP